MTEKQVTLTGIENKWLYSEEDGDYPKITAPDGCFYCFSFSIDAQQLCEKLNEMQDKINMLNDENKQLKIRNKGKQAFIDKQDKIIRLLYNQCKDFKEILDDSNITYPIDERLNKFFEEGVKL